MERTEWDMVTRSKLIGFAIAAGLFFTLVLCSEAGFAFIVDHANLLFHEAGHPIFGWVGWRAWQDRNRPTSQDDYVPVSLLR